MKRPVVKKIRKYVPDVKMIITKDLQICALVGKKEIPWDEYQIRKNVGRNEPCYCNSNKKYKKCCWLKY